jgi:hypothetical protein
VGAIGSGLLGASGASRAASSARDAANINQQTLYTLDARARQDLDPFAAVGRATAPILQDLMTGRTNVSDQLSHDPTFQWQSEELQRFNERQLARQGLTNSGAGLELNRRGYSQLLGDNAQRYFNNLYNTVSLGENAAARQANNALQTGQNLAQSNTLAGQQIGNAQIQQGVAYGNIGTGVANSINSGIGLYQNQLNAQTYQQMFQSMMQRNTPQTTAFSSGGSPFLVNTPGALGTTS